MDQRHLFACYICLLHLLFVRHMPCKTSRHARHMGLHVLHVHLYRHVRQAEAGILLMCKQVLLQ